MLPKTGDNGENTDFLQFYPWLVIRHNGRIFNYELLFFCFKFSWCLPTASPEVLESTSSSIQVAIVAFPTHEKFLTVGLEQDICHTKVILIQNISTIWFWKLKVYNKTNLEILEIHFPVHVSGLYVTCVWFQYRGLLSWWADNARQTQTTLAKQWHTWNENCCGAISVEVTSHIGR